VHHLGRGRYAEVERLREWQRRAVEWIHYDPDNCDDCKALGYKCTRCAEVGQLLSEVQS